MAEENEKRPTEVEPASLEEARADETDVSTRPGWREIFRQAFDKARREQQPTSRRELGRDRSRSLFLLAGAAIAVLLLFLGVFSSSNTKRATNATTTGYARFGAPSNCGATAQRTNRISDASSERTSGPAGRSNEPRCHAGRGGENCASWSVGSRVTVCRQRKS